MSETTLVKQVMLAVTRDVPGVRVWRQNTGVAYGPQELDRLVRGHDVRPVTYGVPGAADISGLALPHGRRVEIECKVGRKYGQTKQQKRYQDMIESHGGIYILATSPQEAVRKLKEALANDSK